MKIITVNTSQDVGEAAALVLASVVRDNPSAAIGFATGSSPMPLYEATARMDLNLNRIRGFALDEYIGLDAGHDQSYARVLQREVVNRLGLAPSQMNIPNGSASDPEQESEDFENGIRATGGIDLQILGIGSNGHLAFNEPPSSFASRTRVVELAQSTRRDNARFFGSIEAVPHFAISQGVATILEAKKLLLMAHGTSKADAVARALQGPVTEDFPASAIQLHPDATVVLDMAAYSACKGAPIASGAATNYQNFSAAGKETT